MSSNPSEKSKPSKFDSDINIPRDEATFQFVDATYRTEDLLPSEVNNEYLLALPAIPDDLALMRALSYLPPFSADERKLPAAQRIQLTGKLRKLFVPVPRVVEFARSMLCMLHAGYENRAPHSAEEREGLASLYADQQRGEFKAANPGNRATQLSFSLMGSSGSGKTVTIENVMRLLPPVIFHPLLGRWQVTFAFIEMAYDGKSLHTIATSLAEEFDRLMPDGRFVETFVRSGRGNAEERMFRMLRAAYRHGLGMLIVDESQNQSTLSTEEASAQRKKAGRNGAKTETPLMKLLTTAANRARLPILFVGTTEFKTAVGTRFTKQRRNVGNGSATWLPFKRVSGKPGEFEIILKTLFRYQWTHETIVYSEAWADLFYEYSQGLTDILVKLWISTQVYALSHKKEIVTEETVVLAFEAEFQAARSGLTALKNRDRLMLDIVSDLCLPEDNVEHYTTAEFGAPMPATPLGTPFPAVSTKSAGPAQASRTSAAKAPARKRSAKKEPASPLPRALDAEVVASADIRAMKLSDFGAGPDAKVQVVSFDGGALAA